LDRILANYGSDQKQHIEAVNRWSFDLQRLKDERHRFGVHVKPFALED
jgi:hypothetical protein